MESKTLNIDGVLNAVMQELGQTYNFITRLGGGEYSNVYLVTHRESGQELAIKIMDYHYLMQKLEKESLKDSKRKFDEIKKRFLMEAKMYEKIQHPNIVKIYDTGFIEEQEKNLEVPYIVMSYIRGSSLAEIIREKGAIEPEQAVSYSRNILSALQAIHKEKIVHRDLKPANLMIDENTGQAIIIDFGISKDIVAGTRLTTTGSILGSPVYMAPEQFIDSRDVGQGVDIYAYGTVLYEMLTGTPPFEGNFVEVMTAHRERPIPDPRKRKPHLPQHYTVVLSRAMAKEPTGRYKSPEVFLKAIEEAKYDKPKPRVVRYAFLLCIVVFAAGLAFFLLRESAPPAKMRIAGTVNENFNALKTTSLDLLKKKKVTPPGDTGGKTPVIPELTPGQILENDTKKFNADYAGLNKILGGDPLHLSDVPTLKKRLNACRKFLRDAKKNKSLDKIEGAKEKVKKIKTTKSKLDNEIKFREKLAKIPPLLKTHDFTGAEQLLADAGKLVEDKDRTKDMRALIKQKKAGYEKIHGTKIFNGLKPNIAVDTFLEFKSQYPNSKHIAELKKILLQSDPNLPPESYWPRPIRKNAKGYYEFTFGDAHNQHRMIYIPSRNIWIDKYEVSNHQFKKFLQAAGQPVPDTGPKKDKYLNRGDLYPVVVTYSRAEAYCAKYQLRIPTKSEWEDIAGKGTGAVYPWGNQPPGENDKWQANFDSLGVNSAKERDGYEGTAPVNSFEKYASVFGTVNMAGNVWEWVQGPFLKGGSFLSSRDTLKILYSNPGSSSDKQGFRCVKVEK